MSGLLGLLGLLGFFIPTREICHGDRRQGGDGVVSPVASRMTVLIGGVKPRQHPQQPQQSEVLNASRNRAARRQRRWQ
jgi:hypothetical protein